MQCWKSPILLVCHIKLEVPNLIISVNFSAYPNLIVLKKKESLFLRSIRDADGIFTNFLISYLINWQQTSFFMSKEKIPKSLFPTCTKGASFPCLHWLLSQQIFAISVVIYRPFVNNQKPLELKNESNVLKPLPFIIPIAFLYFLLAELPNYSVCASFISLWSTWMNKQRRNLNS